jgi:hypothetical protein
MGDRRDIPIAEDQEANKITDGIALCPFEVPMRNSPGRSLQVDQQGRNGVGHHRAGCTKDRVFPEPRTRHAQRALELGDVPAFDFQEIQPFVGTHIVEAPDPLLHIASLRQPAIQVILLTSRASSARVCGLSRSVSGTKRRLSTAQQVDKRENQKAVEPTKERET